MEQPKNGFVLRTTENADLNQYWYSPFTIEQVVKELEASGCTKAAFLSTPSLYFSLPKGSALRVASWVFDLDEQWSKDPHYFKFDFRQPEAIPHELHHTFDCVVIDPPFITREVWELYAAAAKLLLVPDGGKVVCSTVAENERFMKELLDVEPCAFRPSIPHLVYQYKFFANYPVTALGVVNPEVPEDD